MKMPEIVRETLLRWVRKLKRGPDVQIAGEYLLRWIIFRTPLLSAYVHFFCEDDAGRELHDHRSWTLSLLLEGSYIEVVPFDFSGWQQGDRSTRSILRRAGDVVLRNPRDPHRIVMGASRHAITIFLTGPTVRVWGFWTLRGWVRWDTHLLR